MTLEPGPVRMTCRPACLKADDRRRRPEGTAELLGTCRGRGRSGGAVRGLGRMGLALMETRGATEERGVARGGGENLGYA
jgi:hypothetical protein